MFAGSILRRPASVGISPFLNRAVSARAGSKCVHGHFETPVFLRPVGADFPESAGDSHITPQAVPLVLPEHLIFDLNLS